MPGIFSMAKLIKTLDVFKKSSTNYHESRTQMFSSLEQWAMSDNNNAIVDVSNCSFGLFVNFERNFATEKNESLKRVKAMFLKFQEYDKKLHDLEKRQVKAAKELDRLFKKLVKKGLDPESNPVYVQAQINLDQIELKVNNLREEILVSKSILFKTKMIQLTESWQLENEAERSVLTKLKSCLERIPDITEQEVDNIHEIMYTPIDSSPRDESNSTPRANPKLYPDLSPYSFSNSPPPSYDQING